MEGSGRFWKVLEGSGRCWKVLEGFARFWDAFGGFLKNLYYWYHENERKIPYTERGIRFSFFISFRPCCASQKTVHTMQHSLKAVFCWRLTGETVPSNKLHSFASRRRLTQGAEL